MAVVDQQDAVTGGCGARALQWTQKIVQVTIAGGDLVIARAMLARQITQLLAVQSRQQDAALVVAEKATLAQRDRGAWAGADAEERQLRTELPGMLGQDIPGAIVQAAGHQQYLTALARQWSDCLTGHVQGGAQI